MTQSPVSAIEPSPSVVALEVLRIAAILTHARLAHDGFPRTPRATTKELSADEHFHVCFRACQSLVLAEMNNLLKQTQPGAPIPFSNAPGWLESVYGVAWKLPES
jgi:hypothetical protein